MLRSLAFAFRVLSPLAGPAAPRGKGPAGGARRAEAKAAFIGAKAERASLLRRAVSVRSAVPQSTMAACSRTRGGALRCRGGAVQTVSLGGWARGLPPALGVQAQACPAGTMATLAEGHDDIVRCIPI